MCQLFKYGVMILATFSCFVVAGAQDYANTKQVTDKETHIQEVIKTLERLNPLRQYLEDGERGDGIRFQWMDDMQKLGMKQASYIISFDWNKGSLTTRIIDVSYHPKYYQYDIEITDVPILKRVVESGLEKKLNAEAITRARKFIPRHINKPDATVCGKIYINLLDDEALPILNDIPDVSSNCDKDKKCRNQR